ncbi:MAG: J domain-containing protein [Spirulinaceae cyanobacterium RM2_2_10]|nr:J domain-containing protein [Spirulinaceae cyanobacterium SM2_1_0]NJO19792.1 J domain-containing protein [Spirulinaceae cyanobacterium RM2_2_10]
MARAVLTPKVQSEIVRLTQAKHIDARLLEEFAYFVIQSSELKTGQATQPLKTDEIKQAIFERFNVQDTAGLKKSGAFLMATDGMEKLDFRLRENWEMLYRKLIGILPSEQDQVGYGCINGVNVFEYFKPWSVFDLDPQKATQEDVKTSYRKLAKVYHPDNPETGDRAIFEQLEIMYKSIVAGF